jgi:hypothetical protein
VIAAIASRTPGDLTADPGGITAMTSTLHWDR